MYQVRKRTGDSEIFELSKIKLAIKKAFDSCERNYQDQIIELLALKSLANAEKRIKNSMLSVEDIQDSVESILMGYGYEDVAKSYILYRKQHEKARNAKDTVLDYKKTIEGYTKAMDWRVKENSSIEYSLGGLILSNSGAMTANYWLSEIYDEEIANAHRNCDIHIHDLSMLSGYCFTGDTKVGIVSDDCKELNYVSFEELVKLDKKEFNIIAHTGKEDEFVITKAENPRITRHVKNLVEVTVRTVYGDVKIKSTEDHLYMVEDYTYVPANKLQVGQYLVGILPEPAADAKDITEYMSEYCPEIVDIRYIKFSDEIPVYDLTVPTYHNFAVDGNIFVHNCAGWSLKTLIKEGFNGVAKKISSRPAKHLSTICNQMVNFLGTMSLEWAGAQAFNSVDTLLAPFVKAEGLSYKEVKQNIQSLVHGLNISSRWGCLSLTTQVATPNGFKYYSELSVGDEIFTWVNGTLHTAKLNNILYKKNESGVLHRYIGKSYAQTVSPEHRCIVLNKSKKVGNDVIRSENLFVSKKDVIELVDGFKDTNIKHTTNLSDDEVMFAAIYYCDGSADTDRIREITKSSRRDTGDIVRVLNNLGLKYSILRKEKISKSGEMYYINRYHIFKENQEFIDNLIGYKYKIDDKFLHMSTDQSKLFIETWAKFDGSINGRVMCQYDNDDIRDALEIIMIRAGYMPHIWSRKKKNDKYPTNYVFAGTRQSVRVLDRKEIEYSGDVWCPSTEDGTAIYRDEDGNIFISGNSQPVFSNFTFDWTVPDDLAELNCIVGGEELDFKYKDCKREMDMINRAFMEVMLEGDADGKSFAYPIN